MSKPILDLPDSARSKQPKFLWALLLSGALLILGFGFKVLHWPFSSFIILLSATTMIFYFMLRILYKRNPNWRHYTLFASLALTTLGVTMRYLNIETFRILLIPGLIVLCLYVLVSATVALRKRMK